ncbi:MAG: hypothetical protein OXT09_27040 [Myxococcales bacterium]|nr:hypothetical protein [Myxococcales bacterium]
MRDRVGVGARALAAWLLLAVVLVPQRSLAWVFHEHREITERAVARLSGDERAQLAMLWAQARTALPSLCEELLPERPHDDEDDELTCAGLGELPALAADHSCSVRDLHTQLVRWEMAPAVMAVSRQTEHELKTARDTADHLDAFAMQHLRLQRVDDQYLPRAANEMWHFQLSRGSDRLEPYLASMLSTGQEANAIALYASHHAAALALAQRAREADPATIDPAVVLEVLLRETFALHFLQDAFSAGHVVGAHGDRGDFMGTHDYYSERGVSARTWGDPATSYHAHGDSFMAQVDLEHASAAATLSLAQVLAALTGSAPPDRQAELAAFARARYRPGTRTCRDTRVPVGLEPLVQSQQLREVMARVIAPTPHSPLPYQHTDELGVYIAAGWGVDGSASIGFAPDGGRYQARLLAHLGGGFGAEGITTSSHQSRLMLAPAIAISGGSPLERNLGVGATWHVPFGYVPFDGLFWLPYFEINDRGARSAMRTLTGWGDIYRRFRLGRSMSFQLTFLRSGTLIYYPRYDTSTVANADRLELTLPLCSLTLVRSFASSLGSTVELELALHAGHTEQDQPGHGDEGASSLGLLLSLSNTTGYYLP